MNECWTVLYGFYERSVLGICESLDAALAAVRAMPCFISMTEEIPETAEEFCERYNVTDPKEIEALRTEFAEKHASFRVFELVTDRGEGDTDTDVLMIRRETIVKMGEKFVQHR